MRFLKNEDKPSSSDFRIRNPASAQWFFRSPSRTNGRKASKLLAGIVGAATLSGTDFVISSQAVAQQIEMEIREPRPTDDYLTWAPAPARIRQLPGSGTSDKRVVLTNDPEGNVPPGRQFPLDGDLQFSHSVVPGATATGDTLEVLLPKDASWVSFVVAGKFPRASTEDKDALIEVHEGTADGAVVYRHSAMVRIRKDHRELTAGERSRFLNALSRLHREARGFEKFVRTHELASMGKFRQPPDYFWPDLSHRGPGFLPWHRAYLLSFERELQKIDPAVTLPYWKMELLTSVFEENFVGANAVSTEAFVEPTFIAGNPLEYWIVNGQRLFRFPNERRDAQDLKSRFFADDALFTEQAYERFSRKLEGNPHNVGHNWTGPWMRNCMISPSDPVFWPFHTGFDRQWAKWQWIGGHIRPDGSNGSYLPNDAYDGSAAGCNVATPNACVPIGHHLLDTMWPWDSRVGPAVSIKGNRPPADLSQGYIGPFPSSTIKGLWPSSPATPTIGDMIDYAGASSSTRMDMGFAYDDVPFGEKAQGAVVGGASTPAANIIRTGSLSNSVPQPQEQLLEMTSEQKAALSTARDKRESDRRRIDALRLIASESQPAVVSTTLGILDEPNRSAELAVAAIEALSVQMNFGDIDFDLRHKIADGLSDALFDKDNSVRVSALRALASHQDEKLIKTLVASLEKPEPNSFSAADAIRGLEVAGAADAHAATIRKYVLTGGSNVRAAAISALSSDAASQSLIARISTDSAEPEEVRVAAVRSFAGKTETAPALMKIIANQSEKESLRQQAAGSLAATIETAGRGFSQEQLNKIFSDLRTLDVGATLGAPGRRALEATDAIRQRK